MADETKKIVMGGDFLRARAVGEGDPTLFFVHGFADGMDVWDGVVGELEDLGRRIVVEQRGHGFSAGPDGPYAWEDLGRDLIAVADALGVGRMVLVGHGLGGLACLEAALQAPDRVERLVLIGTATEADAEQENWCREVVKAGRMNALQGIAHAIFGPMSRKEVDGVAGPLIELAKCMETLRAAPTTARMSAISAPTLLLRGEKDPAHGQSLADALPAATLETLAGQGHFPHKKDPGAVAAAIRKFVAA